MRNERTNKRVASIAGRVLSLLPKSELKWYNVEFYDHINKIMVTVCTMADIKALAASALTQAIDKPKLKRTKNVKKRSE